MKNNFQSGTIKFYMRTNKPNKNGEYAVSLELSKYGKRGYVSLGIFGSKDFWDPQQEQFKLIKGLRKQEEKKENEEREKNNETIAMYRQRVKNVMHDFEKKGVDWKISQFKEAFIPPLERKGNIHDYFVSVIKTMRDTGHYGNADTYTEILNSLKTFDSNFKDRDFYEIDYNYVIRYDEYYIKKGNGKNARRNKLATLRAILNRAIKDKLALRDTYPFGVDGYSVNKLREQTEKRYLPTTYLNLLKNSSSIDPRVNFARKLFLFSYYSYGMSFIDMAYLKTANIVLKEGGNYIVYKRQKTKNKQNIQPIKVLIRKELSELIKELQVMQKPINDYLLPIVDKDLEGAQLHWYLKTGPRRRMNDSLKVLANDLELKVNLTTYVSRHTMAMQLRLNSVSIDIIGETMGHQETSTTKIYLDSFEDSVVDDATSVL